MSKQFYITDMQPMAATQYGPVHGMQFDEIYTFKGIPYAQAKRFQQPQAPEAWTEPKDCYCYGYECPKMLDISFKTALYLPRCYWPEKEQCQYLNVWTPAMDPNAKKSVMVWLHGGGYAQGSGNAHISTDGHRLAKDGDVVVVTLNHRLNWLGYFDMSAFGEKYANSVNAGNADIVFALQWVHDNIANFGGDPGNVTLFGQSGGGMKVLNMVQTPAAAGLFHRGIVQSGVSALGRAQTPQERKNLVLDLLKALDLQPEDVEQLETLPYEQISKALLTLPSVKAQGLMAFRPQANEWYPGDVREVGLSEHGRKIDLIVGTAFAEFHVPKALDHRFDMTWEEAREKAILIYGPEYADPILCSYQKAYPEKPPFDMLYLDSYFRKPSLDVLDVLAQTGEGRYYSYVMAHDVPIGQGLPMRHSMDNPYVFRTTELIPACNGPETDILQDEISFAWMAFAKTGDPSHDALTWTRYTAQERGNMVFSNAGGSAMRVDHDRELAGLVFGRHKTIAGE